MVFAVRGLGYQLWLLIVNGLINSNQAGWTLEVLSFIEELH
jgi:hypothetical protein